MMARGRPKIAPTKNISSLQDVRDKKPGLIFYSSRTCWWTADPHDLCCKHQVTLDSCDKGCTADQLPLDPAGAPLYQTEDVEGFLHDAEIHPEAYGKHGLEAFVLAYHGNVIDSFTRKPLCGANWAMYNDLIDYEALTAENTKN